MKTLSEKIDEIYDGQSSIERVQKLLNMGYDAYIRGNYPKNLDRYYFCGKYGFVVPCCEMIECINRYGQIVEVGAGTGHISKLLNDSIATDIKDNKYRFTYGEHVEQLNAIDAAAKYPERAILCSWPCYDDPWAAELLKTLQKDRIFIYIGESWGGCTGDKNFHQYLYKHCEKIQEIDIPQWRGIHDYLTVYKVNVK